MDAERIAELRRDLDDDVILNREDIRDLLDAAERWAAFKQLRKDLPDNMFVFMDGLDAAIDAAMKGGD